jgi:hypothetical protein
MLSAMGAWGEQAFQNDSALDWLAEFEVGGLAMLRETLSRVAGIHVDDYLDMDDGMAAIAAAEIVAAAFAQRRDRVPEEVSAWLDAHQESLTGDDQVLARAAVERVLAAESELRESWEEGGPENGWHADVRVLLSRLPEHARRPASVKAMASTRNLVESPSRVTSGRTSCATLLNRQRSHKSPTGSVSHSGLASVWPTIRAAVGPKRSTFERRE